MRRMLLASLLLGVLLAGAGHAAGERGLTYAYIPFDQLDPQRISDGEPVAGQNLLEGLVSPDAAGLGVVPASADTWKVSSDRTVYTFHIRSDARWSDGTPVTAQDFAWSYRRLLTPSTSALDKLNGASSYQSVLGIRNAVNYQLGKVTDWSQVGVKALDRSHLRIVLASPNPDFLAEMAHPSMVALPERNLTRFPYSWQTPAHWVGNGPFVIDSWAPNSTMVMVPNESYWDRRHVRLDRVTITTGQATDAQLLQRYERGQVDIAQIGDPRAFTKNKSLAHALIRVRQYAVVFLTLIPSKNPALEDVRARQAIALAVGRAGVANANPLAEPATSLVPSTLPGFDASVGFTPGVAKARRLLAAAGFPNGKGFPTFEVMTSYDDPMIAAALRTLGRNLGIHAVQDVEDPGVYTAKRHEVQPSSRVGYFATGYGSLRTWRDWVYKYPPNQIELLSLNADDYTHYEVLQARGTAKALDAATRFLEAHASAQSRRFAAVTAAADATANPERARSLYKLAAAIRQSTYELIPLAYLDAAYAIRPGIQHVHAWPGYGTISFKRVSRAS